MAMKKKGYRKGGKVKRMNKGGAAGGKKPKRIFQTWVLIFFDQMTNIFLMFFEMPKKW